MRRKNSFFRATDLIRIIITMLLISAVVIPKHEKEKEETYWENFYAKREFAKELAKKEMDEWHKLSYDEQFKWLIEDMDRAGTIIDVVINDAEDSIYICVLGLPIEKMPNDALEGYIEYEKYMSSFAYENRVDKDIYVVGVSKTGIEYWRIDYKGEIADMFNDSNNDDSISL